MSCGKRRYTRHGKAAKYSTEWYTPERYARLGREVLGEIDLDPASSSAANQVIGARRFYSQEEDGTQRPWGGLVFVNPPNNHQGTLVRQYWTRANEHALGGGPGSAVLWVGFSLEQLRTLQACPAMASGRAPPPPSFWPHVVSRERIFWVDARTGAEARSTGQGSFFALLGGEASCRARFRTIFGALGDYHPGKPWSQAQPAEGLREAILAELGLQRASGSALARAIHRRKADVYRELAALVGAGLVMHRDGVYALAHEVDNGERLDAPPDVRPGVPSRDLWRKRQRPPTLLGPIGLDDHASSPSRPRTLAECPAGPCPYLSCRHHLYVDVHENDEVRITWPELLTRDGKDVSDSFDWGTRETCSLRVAADGEPRSTYEVGKVMNWHRSTVEKTLKGALAKLKDTVPGLALASEQDG